MEAIVKFLFFASLAVGGVMVFKRDLFGPASVPLTSSAYTTSEKTSHRTNVTSQPYQNAAVEDLLRQSLDRSVENWDVSFIRMESNDFFLLKVTLMQYH